MPLSDHDKAHVGEILDGYGDWYHAKLLRAVHSLLPCADQHNRAVLHEAFPDVCEALYNYYRSEGL